MSRAERRVMVRRPHPGLSLSRQCRLLSIGRSWLYYTPKGESAESLALMRRIDELFLKQAGVFYGFLPIPFLSLLLHSFGASAFARNAYG